MTADNNHTYLLRSVQKCSLCSDLPLGPRPILQFAPSAKLLIVGQAPGRITHHKGIPFDDPSGERLRSWLGIDRTCFYDTSQVAILPMGFCYPGTAKNGDLPPRTECASAWRRQILDTLSDIQLTLVIGRYAIDWHLPDYSQKTVTEAVGAWSEVWPRNLILPHPSPRNNRWLKANPWFEKDVVPMLQTRLGQLLESEVNSAKHQL